MTVKDIQPKNWWQKLLNFFHIYLPSQVEPYVNNIINVNDAAMRQMHTDAEKTMEELRSILRSYDALKKSYDQASDLLGMRNRHVAQLEAEIERLQNVPEENLEYVKDVQKQLSEVLHESSVFGFPNKIILPGSTSIAPNLTTDSEGKEVITIRGRSLVTSDVVEKIEQHPDMLKRLDIVFQHLEQYQVLARISKELIRSGTMAFTLAYNEQQKTYEVYYEIDAYRQDIGALCVLKMGKKEDAEG